MAAKLVTLVLLVLLVLNCKGIGLGDKLGAGQPPWMSLNSTFAFGFHTSDGIGELFTLAIWHQRTGTVVWEATEALIKNGSTTEKPKIKVGKTGELELKETGLIVTDKSMTVWLVRCENCSIATASLEETGNFVLLDRSSDRIWQSFDFPTDTLLPGQELRGNTSLVAGKYRLSMNRRGIELYFQDYLNQSYWGIINKQLNTSESTMTSTPKFTFSIDGHLAFFDANGSSWYRYKFDNAQKYPIDLGDTSVIRRLTLEKNGMLRSYSCGSGEKRWRVVWQSALLECEIFGTCGAFGLCGYKPRKSCSCPPGFHAVDSSESAGCVRNFPLSCSSGNATSSASKMVEVQRAMYVGNLLQQLSKDPISLEQCKVSCLKDCRCLGATYMLAGTKRCSLLGGEDGRLFNGVQAMERTSIALLKVSALDPLTTSFSEDVFVTVLDAYTPSLPDSLRNWSYFSDAGHRLVFAIAIGELASFLCIALSAWFCWRRSLREMWKKAAKDHRGPTWFSYEQLEVATNHFSCKLGAGGFGSVYKGVLPDMTVVAVKTLEGAASHGEKQFKAEVATLGRVHHVNLVKLLGYCAEGSHRLLVYEFLSNGSLDQECSDLWGTRYSIALGVAKGITYLHEECYDCILHCDIKPQNVLLDENFCPKVSDFGLAKLTDKERALDVTTIRGTRGYMAPEWVGDRPITSKVDVYSYGMVLLELLSGNDKSRIGQNRYFPVWAFQKYVAGELHAIADPGLKSLEWNEFERMIKVAFWCIQLDARSRPSMSRVVQMLEEPDLEVAVPPFPTPASEEVVSGNSPSFLPPLSQSVIDPR
ncbi:G-type lectin S-receptor-like serine/threonine-protein kinase At1g34300 [Selaginella moellendorffii]|nr:G-type lectin S-receptor-like serine/threonine-protein kinase At1g34300 [Selaginella moellendorffii]|eukprot:XP_024523559.1 G-type lectin S-receptor-like serine/threonine-protein kinase At1g34300 [Selaginella moellendorffii]